MRNITFLIGNGFDLSFGLKSQYQDIYDAYYKTNNSDPSIMRFKKELVNWSDFEMNLAVLQQDVHQKGRCYPVCAISSDLPKNIY